MTARDEILARIGRALDGAGPVSPVPRDYRGAGGSALAAGELVERFDERVADYHATVHHCGPEEIAAAVGRVLAGRGARRIVVPPGFPADWFPGGLGVTTGSDGPGDSASPVAVGDRPELTIDELDQVDGVLTSCAVAIAETGTIVLNHGDGQGRRALTLVPDLHVVVVRAEQIVPAVPDAIAALDPGRPMTWISGPSATSDIELSRVEGVHGPRRLDVIIAASA